MALDISSPLPTAGGDLGTWGTELNTAITEIINEAGKDSDIVSLQSTKADKGTAYSNLENNVKIVQGVPAGGKMYLGNSLQTGAIKIKLPSVKEGTMFKFRIKISGYSQSNKQSNTEYVVKGINNSGGFGITSEVSASCQVTTVKDNPSSMSPTFYFCTGATEDYILIGEITDVHSYKTVVIDDVEKHMGNVNFDWSKDWAISLVTTLETLTSQYKVAVTPSLNSTHLGGISADQYPTLTKLENNVKVIQGVPIGGQNYFANTQTGAIKIKLPTKASNAMYSFTVKLRNYTTNKNIRLRITGFNVAQIGADGTNRSNNRATIISDNLNIPNLTVYFCNGETEDYILIGEITQSWSFLSVVVSEIEYYYAGVDWSKDWSISLVTSLETLTSNTQIAVTPSLNATHLNGVQETTTGEASKIMKLGTNGEAKAQAFQLTAMNTAPASPTATGTTGEIRVTPGGIYYCIATNTWRKALPVSIFTETITGLTSTFTASTLPAVSANLKYLWKITNTLFNVALVESTHNSYAGGNTLSLITGATVATVTANSIYSVRIGDSVLEIKIDTNTRAVSYRIASGTITEITVIRLQYEVSW